MAIQGYAEGIQTGVLPIQKSAGVILEESDRMTEIIEELLALSKIDSAQAKPKFREADLAGIINGVANSLAPAFENGQKNLKPSFAEKKLFCATKSKCAKPFQILYRTLSNFAKPR